MKENRKLKILITSDLYSVKTNGVVTSVTNLANELKAKGHDVKILTLSENFKSYVENDVYYVRSFSMNKIYPGVRGVLPFKSELIHELIDWKPDIVHSQCEFFTFQYAKHIAKQCNVPIVHTYHTLYEDYVGYVGLPPIFRKRIAKRLSNLRLKHAETVIAPSQKVFSILKDYGLNADIQVIPSGISLDEHFKPVPEEKILELKNKLGLKKDDFVLLSLGRLGKEKNIDELLKGLSKIVEDSPNVVLMIVGDGPDRRELEDLANDLKLNSNVIFVGAVAPDDVHLYYQLADVFVSASTSETQGLVFIEAAANGLPLICHKDPCLLDVLDEDENGYSYETLDEFEEAFNEFIKDDEFRKEASIKSIQNASKFSKQEFGERIENIYYSLISDIEK